MEISVDGVCVDVGRRRALLGVDWLVRPGVTGLLGPNDSEKTTMLDVLSGRLRPVEGRVTARRDTESASLCTTPDGQGGGVGVRFGFVPQRWSVAGRMRVTDVVAYTAWMNGMSSAECESAARRAVAAVGLADRARDRVRLLTGAGEERLGIAAGLVHDPEALLLDEPTAELDPGSRRRVWELIAEVGRTRTVVVSSQLLDEVALVCERMGVLVAGRLVFDGTVADLERFDLTNGGDGESARGERSAIVDGYERLLRSVGGVE